MLLLLLCLVQFKVKKVVINKNLTEFPASNLYSSLDLYCQVFFFCTQLHYFKGLNNFHELVTEQYWNLLFFTPIKHFCLRRGSVYDNLFNSLIVFIICVCHLQLLFKFYFICPRTTAVSVLFIIFFSKKKTNRIDKSVIWPL